MKNLILSIAVLVTGITMAQQGRFEEGMGRALQLWSEGKDKEASDMFERIATAEKNSWLPNYYVALINTTAAFKTRDKEMVSALLNKAQAALDHELVQHANNAELLVMQAMIDTGWVVYDPMTNGMKLSGKIMETYGKALAVAPDNPRAVFGKAQYEIGGAKYFGTDIKPMCAEIDRAIDLFAKFKPESAFAPRWGLDQALEAQKECKK